ncbi:hypothetical protein SHKM778_81690 [Streptomyces sp. KM77-8]|uniref:Tetratricopeptide repeat protein n=1 Tax=Streptomyces haneummycinicus TaxID=3074435 RepID=A0AAT9HWZ9_9ACTN
MAAASLGPLGFAPDASAAQRAVRRAGASDAGELEEAVRRIRLLDDRHGADGLYRRAAALAGGLRAAGRGDDPAAYGGPVVRGRR